MKIQLLNKIAKCGTAVFDDTYTVGEEIENPDAIMVRSAAMHDMQFSPNLKAIARAGAGVNNIPVDRCADEGIVVFNTPGANANAVKELVMAGLLLASRDIIGGVNWVKENADDPDIAKSVEKNKSKFAGNELKGKKLGVIGLGAIGGPLCNLARHFGMEVYGCDPYLSVEAAWNISRDVHRLMTREEVFKECDFISLHTPLVVNDDPKIATKGMINEGTIAMMKDGAVVLNFARDALVDDDAMEKALASGKIARYVTDFPNARTAGMKGVIAIPHLGASTEEAEDNCAIMAAHELDDFLKNGNIKNSVNYPNVELPHNGDCRLCIFHKNIPTILSQITSAVSEENINIENFINKSKKDNAYTVVEINGDIPEKVVDKVKAIEGVIRIRVIK